MYLKYSIKTMKYHSTPQILNLHTGYCSKIIYIHEVNGTGVVIKTQVFGNKETNFHYK